MHFEYFKSNTVWSSNTCIASQTNSDNIKVTFELMVRLTKQ